MEGFLNNVDIEKVDSLMLDTENNVKYFEDTMNKVVSEYSDYLDEVMKNIHNEVIKVDNPSEQILEKYFLELSNVIYFMCSKLEKLGIYDAMSKVAYKEMYNKAYLGNQEKDYDKKNKTTVAENQAVAENASVYENAVNEIYNRAYKVLKNKVDAAQTMVSTLSKIISRRMAENQFSNMNNNSRKILNEEVVPEYKPF